MTFRDLRERAERAFEQLARTIVRHPRKVLVAALALTLGLAANLPKLDFDTSIDGFLKPTDTLRLEYDEFRRDFGRDEMILVALKPKNVFDPEFLKLLKTIHRDLEENVPRLDEVTSLVNARNTYGRGDVLAVDDLLLEIPETPEGIARLREQAMSDPVYRDLWITDDGTIANIAVESDAFDLGEGAPSLAEVDDSDFEFDFDASAPAPIRTTKPLRSEHNAEVVAAVREIVEKYRSPELEIRVGGSPSMTARLLLTMEHDLKLFMGAALGVISLLLALVFKRVAGVVLPIVVVVLTVVSMLGVMAALEVDVAFGTQILPSAMLAIGIGYAVHVLTFFFRRYDEERDKEAAIVHAVGHSGVGVTLSAVTTAVGFGSFMTSELLPLFRMGCVAPIAVALAYFNAILVLPALLAVLPLRARGASLATAVAGPAESILVRIGDFSHRNARAVGAVSGLVGVLALYMASQLHFSHDPMHWLPLNDPVRVTHDYLEEQLDGTMVLELVADFPEQNALHSPENLTKLEQLAAYASSNPTGEVEVGKTLSILEVSKEIHQALNEGRQDFYAVPPDKLTVAQEFLLFENSGTDDLEKVTNGMFSKARMTMKVHWVDSTHYPAFIEKVESYAKSLLGSDVRIYTSGMLALMSRTLLNVMDSAARAYLLAFAIITPLMILLLGNLRTGLVSMVPNLFPIIGTLALMSAFGIELDMFTILVGSIALGLAVDDTIHFVHGFSRSYARTGDVQSAILETMRSSGRAILFTTLVLCAGFSVFTLSDLNNLILFGTLTTLAIGLALIADLVITPALLTLCVPQLAKRAEAQQEAPTADRRVA